MAPKPFCVAVQKFAVKWPTGAWPVPLPWKEMTPLPANSRRTFRGIYSSAMTLRLFFSQ